MRQDEIQRLYKNHTFLAHRDMGGVRQLTGTVEALVKQLRYTSVMASTDTTFIDSLTAYLIGWTDHISEPAAAILETTKHFTRETLLAAIRAEQGRG